MKKANRYRVGTVMWYRKDDLFEKVVTKLAPNKWLIVATRLNSKQVVDDDWMNQLTLTNVLTVIHDNGKVKA